MSPAQADSGNAVAGLVNDGNGGNDYVYTFMPVTSGTITALAITVTAVADTKTYDGTKSSTKTPTLSLTLPLGDSAAFTQSFDTKDVGTSKTLTPAGLVNDGNGGNDYAYTFTPVTSGTISALAITVTASANTKIFDGTTTAAAVPTITAGSLVGGDVGTFTEVYDNKNVGSSHVLTPTGTVNDSGGVDVTANYAITFATINTGDITQANSTTTLASSANQASLTNSVAFTATVASTGGTPTGTVIFTVDGAAQAPIALASGNATFTSSTLSVGNHTVTAAYSGDTNFTASTSAALTQTINETTPPTVLSQATSDTTTGTVGVPVTFTFGVSDPSQVTFTWDFGDGTSGVNTTNTTAGHTFTAPGVYTIKVTATNAGGQSVTSTMTFTVVAAATAPGSLCGGLNPIPMHAQLVSAKLAFSAGNKDGLALKGVLNLPNGFKVQGQLVQWEIGGIQGNSTLDGKGKWNQDEHHEGELEVQGAIQRRGVHRPLRHHFNLDEEVEIAGPSTLTLGGISTLNANNTNKAGDPATIDVCVLLTGVQAYVQDGVAGVYKAKKGENRNLRREVEVKRMPRVARLAQRNPQDY